jgi:type IV pilus assembly protein PilE
MRAELLKLKRSGFTLIELMVVVAIIAILVAVSLPLYQESVRKSKRTEAKATLMRIAQLEERYYTVNSTYLTAFPTLLGLGAGAPVYSGEDATNPLASHIITLTNPGPNCGAISSCFLLTAAPNANFSDPLCGSLTLSSTGVRGKVGGSGTLRDCW